MSEHTGWLLDLFTDPHDGVVLWLLADGGQRVRLHQPLAVTFYAAGPPRRLRALWRYLQEQPEAPRLERTRGRDLFLADPLDVLAAETPVAVQPELFRRASEAFPDLTYYNADVPVHLHHAARYGTFPLARLRVEAGEDGLLRALEVLDSPWDLDSAPAPLRVMYLEPDADPRHAAPTVLEVRTEKINCRLPLEPARPLLVNLRALLRQHDPDLLMTGWGDTWLLPHLLELSRAAGIELPLNREPGRGVVRREERSYFSYGQIVFRGAQVHLFGRWHIDRANAMLWDDYDLDGALEAARVTATPVQACARLSPGSGISAMQVLTALRSGVMVPWHKQQPEQFKTALDLLHSDMGGLVYQPVIGLHRDVAELDFISMYPSVMVRCNISPETRPVGLSEPPPEQPGLIPRTLEPLLKKRVALKLRMLSRPPWDPGRKSDKARVSAHKWLLVTCFGYLGYKNARFGRIEAHEAVTAYGREALMRAKEAVEDLGGEVLHMYVDGLWVKCTSPPASPPAPPLPARGTLRVKGEGSKTSPLHFTRRVPLTLQVYLAYAGRDRPLGTPEARGVGDFQPMLEEIANRTGLPVALDGIYRWVAFLPARRDARVPVPNRYFGVFQDGSLKMRGIEARRRDTPPFVAAAQLDVLNLLATAPDVDGLPALLPQAVELVRARLRQLRAGQVPLEELLAAQKLSRELERYTTPSPAARAAAQLKAVGKEMRPGQRVRLLFLRGEPDVWAWDLPQRPNPAAVDIARYSVLLLRAAAAVLQPFGLDEAGLKARLSGAVARRLLP